MQKQIIVLAVTLVAPSVLVLGATDTPETRRNEAERYLQANPPKALFADMADKMAANLPPDQREQFKRVMTTQLDVAALTKAMTDAMVKNFTTEELKALADFYSSGGKISHAKVRRLHGRHYAGNPGGDNESVGKTEPVAPEPIATVKSACNCKRSYQRVGKPAMQLFYAFGRSL